MPNLDPLCFATMTAPAFPLPQSYISIVHPTGIWSDALCIPFYVSSASALAILAQIILNSRWGQVVYGRSKTIEEPRKDDQSDAELAETGKSRAEAPGDACIFVAGILRALGCLALSCLIVPWTALHKTAPYTSGLMLISFVSSL